MIEIADLRSKIMDYEVPLFAPAFTDEELQQLIDTHGDNLNSVAGHVLLVLAEDTDRLRRWMLETGDIVKAADDLRSIGMGFIDLSKAVNGEPI